MKRFFVFCLIIFSLAIVSAAQSGRRVKAAPTPAPTPQTGDDAGDYSESAPNKMPAIYARPRDIKNKSKNKTETAPNPTLPEAQTTGKTSTGDDEILKVETNLITIPVSVYERSGIYVPNLRREDFKIFEDGKEQEVAYFGTADKPFTVVLLLDVSPSTAYKIEEIQAAATAFVDQMKPEDSVMVIEFDNSVRVLTESTNDRDKIYKAIHRTGFGNGTSLYEAVDFSLRKRLDKIQGRKAIVLFTDGVDTTSHSANFENTVGEAEESDSIIFPIYFNTFLDMMGIGRGGVMSSTPTLGIPGGAGRAVSADYARGRAYLESLAAVTGGRVFRPESTPGGLAAAFEGIAEELRSQYSIGYYPQSEGAAGERRQIKVRVNRANVAVRARDSYIVGANNQKQSSN